ncbi:MAG: tetratricopeptide repeat protein [Bacteroidota bacterium]
MRKYLNQPIAIILGITALIFFPILNNQFTFYSDDVYVLNNVIIQNLSWHNIKFIFSSFFDGHYHPLTLLSLGFTYSFSEVNPALYQFTNLLFHLLNTFLVFILAEKLFKNRQLSIIVALLFGIHPIHVESVARITERKDMQYAFFFLLSLITYIKYLDLKRINYLIFTFLLFILSVLSKGQAITLSFVLILIDYYYKRDFKNYRVWLEKIPFLSLSIIGAYLNFLAQKYTGYFSEAKYSSIFEPFLNASYVFDNYIFKLFAPFNLSAQYDSPYIIGQSIPASLYIYLIIALSIGVLALWKFKKHPLLIFGLFFYLINIGMMLRWFDIAENVMPDRYNYVASIGFFIIIGVFYNDFYKKIKQLKIISFAYIGILCILTFLRADVWKNGLSVWEDAYNKNESSATSAFNYGIHLLMNKDIKNAMIAFNKASENDHNFILPYMSRSNVYQSSNDSVNIIKEKIKIIHLNVKVSDALANRAAIKAGIGDFKGAYSDISEAIKINPNSANILFNKGNILSMFGKNSEAIAFYKQAIELKPYNIDEVYFFKSKAELLTGNVEEAIDDIKQTKLFNPKNKKIYQQYESIQFFQNNYSNPNEIKDTNLLIKKGVDFYKNGMYSLSINYFEQLLRIDPTNQTALKFKIYCLYNFGQFDEAKQLLENAFKSSKLVDKRIEDRIKLVLMYKEYILNNK